jgi:signal transduction histidine kinase
MKSFLLAAKIAALSLGVLLVFAALILHLFVARVMQPVSHGHLHVSEAHNAFVLLVLQLGVGAMILMIALAIYVTAPLRRMSRSMDRIAAGDLEHRVAVRGRGEAAVLGHSFNTMADRLQAMIVGQKELMAGVSHELRSPLTRMKLALELLRQGKGGEERIEDLETEVDALNALVEELLFSSRMDLGSVPLELEALNLEELCREAWARVADRAETQGTTLELCLADAGRRVRADRALAVRLLGNLFENAVRYAGPGEITVTSQPQGERLRITVADQGPGVDETDLPHLFDPFFRADRSRSRKTGAGGLGLMIVRRAVEAHGGSVWAERAERAERGEPGGLAVVFDLPIAIAPY